MEIHNTCANTNFHHQRRNLNLRQSNYNRNSNQELAMALVWALAEMGQEWVRASARVRGSGLAMEMVWGPVWAALRPVHLLRWNLQSNYPTLTSTNIDYCVPK